MSKQTLWMLIAIVVIAAAFWYYHYAQNRAIALVGQAKQPLQINQTFVSINVSPSTTNIEKIEGNGHAIGDGNKVQNEGV